jgi:hypothetical protein
MIGLAKGSSDFHLVILHAFCKQWILKALQRVHATFNLTCIVTAGDGFFKVYYLYLFDMLLVIGGGL